MSRFSSALKQFYSRLINAGVCETDSNTVIRTIRKANFYNYITLFFYLLVASINFLEGLRLHARVGFIQFVIFLINHICFRYFKKVRIYVLFYTFFLTATVISGSFHGAGMVVVGLYILTVINLLGLRLGTPLSALVIITEVVVFYMGRNFEWIYSHSSNNSFMFFKLIASHVGIYLFSYYHYKVQNESYNELNEEKENRKQLFLNIVHDLKTPLTILHNSVNSCEKEFNNAPSITLLKSNILKMEKNILNILNIEKLERGFPIADKSSVLNISAITKEVYDLYSNNISSDSIYITSEIDDGIYAKIDEISYIQILNNLIDNAIKYSSGVGIIKITLTKRDQNVYLTIKDKGIGISDSDMQKIFTPYFQGHQGYSSYYGLGIGLALVKEICEAFGGRIGVESCPGEGSIFTVELPIAECREEFAGPSRKVDILIPELSNRLIPNNHDPKMKTILIVEDDQDIMDLLIKSFNNEYNILTAANGIEGLSLCHSDNVIDLILTDIMMPEMNGKEFIKKLHNSSSNRKIPIIFLTAKVGSNEIHDCLALGAVDYICKPFDVKKLRTKIESILTLVDNMQDSLVSNIEDSLTKFILSKTGTEKKNNPMKSNFADYNISPKEEIIINELADGLSHKEIAYNQGISINTVKSHIQRIYKKCNVQNSASLLKLFFIKHDSSDI